jgi:hypothetical protein
MKKISSTAGFLFIADVFLSVILFGQPTPRTEWLSLEAKAFVNIALTEFCETVGEAECASRMMTGKRVW